MARAGQKLDDFLAEIETGPLTESAYRDMWAVLRVQLRFIDMDHSVNGVIADSAAYQRAYWDALFEHNLKMYRRMGLFAEETPTDNPEAAEEPEQERKESVMESLIEDSPPIE